MNQEQDKDLDILLKQHAKRESLRAGLFNVVDEDNAEKSSNSFASEHLDADEMNAYAENVLPSAARLRYVSHLVDCDNCRKLVTQLTLSANPIFVEEESKATVASAAVVASAAQSAPVVKTSETKTWLEKISSFFTPSNLRIAGPVAAVLCISVVSFVVWQRNKNEIYTSDNNQLPQTEVAKHHDTDDKSGGVNTPSVATPTSTPSVESSSQNTSTKGTEEAGKKAEREKQPEKPDDTERKEGTVEEQPKPTKSGEASKDAGNDKRSEDDAPTEKPKSAPAPKNPSKSGDLSKRDGEQPKGTSRNNRDMNENRAEQRQTQTPAPITQTSGGAADSTDRTEKQEENRPKTTVSKKQVDSDDERKQNKAPATDASSETRSVSGKQFRRVGDAWVDVDYKSSATTNIKRGSDQYNATIADEPGIKAFAEQLSGEVIVVWKGRAYRIH